jgi:hypothetical protein
MDDMEFLVAETMRHFHQHYGPRAEVAPDAPALIDVPPGPGIIYHLQCSGQVFVLRTLASQELARDLALVRSRPEDYPTLRLSPEADGLRFFPVDEFYQAEAIHRLLSNRRYPRDEEQVCNLSDPGFSWWLSKREQELIISFNLSNGIDAETIKLGPLGDQLCAQQTFQRFTDLLSGLGIQFSFLNESNRMQFSESDDLLGEELLEFFELGLVGPNLTRLFKLLAVKAPETEVEFIWCYLQELSALRRFWIQVQYDLVS